jgi:hypothetical protein
MSRFFNRITSLLLLPLFLLYQFQLPATTSPPQPQTHVRSIKNFTYDDVLDLLSELEEGNLEARCSEQDLIRIKRFVAVLAKKGIFSNQWYESQVLEQDIRELLADDEEEPYFFISSEQSNFLFMPAISYGQGDIYLVKRRCHKKWDKVKNFCKKHKKELIVGAAIAVATVIVVATCGGGSGAAAGAVGAAAAAVDSDKPKKENSHKSVEATGAIPDPQIVRAVEEKVEEAKEKLAADLQASMPVIDDVVAIAGMARDLGSHIAHEVFDGVAQLVAPFPGLLQEVVDILPQSNLPLHPKENFENDVAKGHQVIDTIFGTDQAYRYEEEYKNLHPKNYTSGTIPVPLPIIGRLFPTLASRICGWKVGDPINNRTLYGAIPSWNTVRARYWRNEAELFKENPANPKYSDPIKYTPDNIKRMEQGLAPQRFNDRTGQMEKVELHHTPPQREGGLFDFYEVWPDEHAALDPRRKLGN